MKRKISILVLLLVLCSFLQFEKNVNNTTIGTSLPLYISTIPIKNTKQEAEKEATLEISKISLKQPYYPTTSSLNTVDKGIEQLSNCKPSENCTIVLAAHSGTSKISYFKNLNKLTKNDEAKIYYKDKTYSYRLVEILYQEKTGFITIPKNTYDLVLTTCNTEKENVQNIYLFVKTN